MGRMRKMNKWSLMLGIPLLSIIFCEYLIYYFVQYRCRWPEFANENETKLRSMIVADTHLLGPYKGHWLDKLRREWQMHRAFVTATTLHEPDVVFFLGDLFDEGQWVNKIEFSTYVLRFQSLFPFEKSHIIVGNHDVGFHYVFQRHDTVARFYKVFNMSSADFARVNGIPFVTINSMTLERDGCNFCKEAERRIQEITKKLDLNERPYLLQHFPLYRKSDETCQGEDSAPEGEKYNSFRPKWDCLSEPATQWLLGLLKPLAVFSGHTHHGCKYRHDGILEYSVPSFSWRNRDNPSYLLVSFSKDAYLVEKCMMPRESTVLSVYIMSLAIAILSFVTPYLLKIRFRSPNQPKRL